MESQWRLPAHDNVWLLFTSADAIGDVDLSERYRSAPDHDCALDWLWSLSGETGAVPRVVRLAL